MIDSRSINIARFEFGFMRLCGGACRCVINAPGLHSQIFDDRLVDRWTRVSLWLITSRVDELMKIRAKRDEKWTPITNYTNINHPLCCLLAPSDGALDRLSLTRIRLPIAPIFACQFVMSCAALHVRIPSLSRLRRFAHRVTTDRLSGTVFGCQNINTKWDLLIPQISHSRDNGNSPTAIYQKTKREEAEQRWSSQLRGEA